jgi:hypothetical protein
MTAEEFDTKAEAEAYVAANGGAAAGWEIRELESFQLPDGFFAEVRRLASAGNPALQAVVACADRDWDGSMACAWADALEGKIRSVPGVEAVCRAMDDAVRAPVAYYRAIRHDAAAAPAQIDSGVSHYDGTQDRIAHGVHPAWAGHNSGEDAGWMSDD